jgi:hypothetical protein
MLSLLACVATLLWWARSFLPPDLHVGAADGRLILLFSEPSVTRYWKYRHGTDRDVAIRPAEFWATARRGRFISPESNIVGAGPDGKPFSRSNNVPPQFAAFAGLHVVTEQVGRRRAPTG